MKKSWTALAAAFFLSACDGKAPAENDIYSLYRNSPEFPGMRVHVATFDAEDTSGSGMNRTNCQIAAEVLAKRPGVTLQFWCEMGRFHPQSQ
jgi:hypothetical protein